MRTWAGEGPTARVLEKGGRELGREPGNIWFFEGFMAEEQMRRILELAPPDDSPMWGGCTFEPQGEEEDKSRQCALVQVGDDATVRDFLDKFGDLWQVNTKFFQQIPIARFKPGSSEVRPHVDYMSGGGSIVADLTALIYLSEVPPELGGQTHFNSASLIVQPKRGAMLAWRGSDQLGQPNLYTQHWVAPYSAKAAVPRYALQIPISFSHGAGEVDEYGCPLRRANWTRPKSFDPFTKDLLRAACSLQVGMVPTTAITMTETETPTSTSSRNTASSSGTATLTSTRTATSTSAATTSMAPATTVTTRTETTVTSTTVTSTTAALVSVAGGCVQTREPSRGLLGAAAAVAAIVAVATTT